MEFFLSAIGIPSSLVDWVLSLNTLYIIAIIIVIFFTKFVIVPSISKSINNIVLEWLNKGDKQILILNEISNKLENNNERMCKIENIVQDLSSDSVGNVDLELAVSTFAYALNSTHLRLLLFYQTRLKSNTIKGNEQIIISRYKNYSNQLARRLFAQLSKYHIKGICISTFFKDGGIESYLNHVSAEFYDIMRLRIDNDEFALSLTDEDLHNGIDRLLSKQMGLFKIWCTTFSDSDIYQNKKNLISIKIIDETLTDVEMLNE